MKWLAWLVALSLLLVSALAPAAWAQGDEVTVNVEDNLFRPGQHNRRARHHGNVGPARREPAHHHLLRRVVGLGHDRGRF